MRTEHAQHTRSAAQSLSAHRVPSASLAAYTHFLQEHAAFVAVGATVNRYQYRRRNRTHDVTADPYPWTPWWAAAGHAACLLVADAVAAPAYPLAALGWRRAKFRARYRNAPAVSYPLALAADAQFLKRVVCVPMLVWGVGVACCLGALPLRGLVAAGCLVFLAAVAWEEVEGVHRHMIVDTGRALERRRNTGERGWRSAAWAQSSDCVLQLVVWVRSGGGGRLRR